MSWKRFVIGIVTARWGDHVTGSARLVVVSSTFVVSDRV
jgi:hypothetical protein